MSAAYVGPDARGFKVHKHGTAGYSRGCRCEACRTGRAEDVRSRRAAAAARRKAAEAEGRVYIASGIQHGTISGYKNNSCRCLACCRAASDYKRGVYRSPVAEQPSSPSCIRCKVTASTGLCCSSHNAALCHRCYRLTHFVGRCVQECARCAGEGLDPMNWPEPAAKVGVS